MKKKSIILCTFIFLQTSFLMALEFQNLTTSNGLSNRRVYNAVRDTKGYIWFATRVSIDRFDGEAFYHYELSEENDNYKIRGVLLDKNGRVYAYSDKFVFGYDTDHDRFEKIAVAGINNTYIRTAYFDSNNTLWLGLNDGLIYSNDLKKWKEIIEIKNVCVYCVNEINPNNLVIGSIKGLTMMKISNLVTNKYSFSQYLPGKRVQSLFYNKTKSELWIGTFADGLYICSTINMNEPQKILDIKYPIRSICNVTPSQIWVAADGNGIYCINSYTGKVIKNFSQSDSNKNYIATNTIYNIFAFDSYVWVSTYTSGIFTCNLKTFNYTHLEHEKDNPNSLRNNHVNVLLEDQDGDLWFGTNAGISFYSLKNSQWKHFEAENDKGLSSVILALSLDKDNNIWAGGYATDLFYISKRNFKITAINKKYKNIGDKKYIYSIYNDETNDIWFGGTIIDKLTKFSPKSGKTRIFNISGVNKIKEYNSDTLLIGAIDGLYVFNKKTEHYTLFKYSKQKHNKRSLSNFINSIYVDELYPGIIWLGTDGGGFYKFNLYAMTLNVYTKANGLTSNYVYGIQRDAFNRLWVSTENGLNCFDVESGICITGLEIYDLSSTTFNYLAYSKSINGNMLWGTPKGVVIINPQKIRNSKALPINLRFNSLNIYYQNMNVGTKGSPLQKTLDDTKSLSLSYSQRSFTFDFIDLNNYSQPKTIYSWKLSGFDKDWSNFSINHKAVYTNIPPGKYTFNVRASKPGSNDYITRSVEIDIAHPFWSSTFAILLYVIFIGAIVFFAMNYWNNRIEARNSEEKIRFFVNMAHDVRTPITLVKAPLNQIELDNNLSDDSKSALKLAQRNLDKLFNIITQLLDFQRVENESMQLSVEETNFNKYIETVISGFTLLAKEKKIDLDLITSELDSKIYIDRKKLGLCIENLISNAIKYTNENGKIQINAEKINGSLVIEISDDGIGIPVENQKNLFERFYRAENASNSKETGSGIGLMLTKRLITLHKGKISFNSIEKFGTTFYIEIPCTKESYKPNETILNSTLELIELENGENDKLSGALKLLLVEDNDEIREFLTNQLRHEYLVVEAGNGNKALELIKQDPPDFILSDIMMPGISGFELCSILKNDIETCHIPIILLSSLSDRSDIIKGLSVGADDYITKPFDMSILESKIKVIVKNRILFKNKTIDKTADGNEFKNIHPLDKAFIEKVILIVEENIANEEFSIEQLAVEMAMSRSVFYKKLKSLTSDNPKDFIKEIRMKKAAKLLLEERYQINEVAYLVGFSNPKHFSTYFRKYYGLSPRGYIEKYIEK